MPTMTEKELERSVVQYVLAFDVAEDICRLMETQSMSRTELAENSGVPLQTITAFFRGSRPVSLNTIVALALALGYETRVFLTKVKP